MTPRPSSVSSSSPPETGNDYRLVSRRYVLHKGSGVAYCVLWCHLCSLLVRTSLESYAVAWFWHYPVLLHAVGLLQTLSALLSFRFLPQKQKSEGFFGDRTTVSKSFVKENAFFILLCVFASLYVSPKGRLLVRRSYLEIPGIFFPFQTLRRTFPKTSFERHNVDKSTARNAGFFRFSKYVASYFYLFGKHYVGFMLNYVMFLDEDDARFRGYFYWILLGAGYNLTFGIFLHTLKFRKKLGPKTAVGAYLLGYAISGVPTVLILPRVPSKVFLLATGGLLANLLGGSSGTGAGGGKSHSRDEPHPNNNGNTIQRQPFLRRPSAFSLYQLAVAAFLLAKRRGALASGGYWATTTTTPTY